jgi:peptidyl-prolyl cis-trans isomerase A (cyclophilin A)
MRLLPLAICLAAGILAAAGPASLGAAEEKNPVVVLATSKGEVRVELFPDKAPVTVKNFLEYVKASHYNGTVFHRVIPGFMIQGGGMDKDLNEKPTRDPIKNEAGNGLKNERGTLSMARRGDPNSATAQFFINVADNAFLNHKDESPQGFGYAVFGKVVKGMEVVDQIVSVKTTTRNVYRDVPEEAVVIESAALAK